jgi:thiamine biosynthesis lipoprotein
MAIDLVVSRVPGWQAIAFDEAARTIRIPHGVDLDLGATAKAMTSDLAAAAALAKIGGGGALVSLGGDIAVAGEPPSEGWLIQASEDSGAPIKEGEGDRDHGQAGSRLRARPCAGGPGAALRCTTSSIPPLGFPATARGGRPPWWQARASTPTSPRRPRS